MQRPARRSRRNRGAILSAFSFATVALLSGTALADSSVYLTNNTSKPIKVKISSTLGTKHWKKKATVIPAWTRREVFETNRDSGVKSGKTYTFTAEVLPIDPATNAPFSQYVQPFAMQLKLKGKTIGSHMWHGVRSQAGGKGTWFDDNQKYGSSFNIKGKKWHVTYWAYFTGNDDNVEYVVRENYPKPEGYGKNLGKEWKQSHLNVLAYNVYMRPTSLFVNGQSKRAKMIPPQIPGYDVVVFQEAFDDGVRKKLLQGMTKQGYKYHSKILGKDEGVEQDGGVIIVSRYPIVARAQRLFNNVCSGNDCMAEKGVNYVKINKKVEGTNNYFHVFGTHLNNGNWGVQKQQLQIMRSFIDSRKIPKDQAVIMAGDMNINRADSAKYNYMLNKLGAGFFSGGQLRGHGGTSDGGINDLGGSSKKIIDYVLYSKRHLGITPASFAEVRVPRALMEWKDLPHEKARWDLSDHFPIYGNLHFKFDPLSDWDPYGGNPPGEDKGPILCTSDADCPPSFRCDKSGGGAPSGGSGGTSKPKPRIIKPRRVASRPGARGTAKASKSRTATKTAPTPKASASTNKVNPAAFRKGMKMVKTGICRIPPPK